jgi:hemolysin D
VSQLAAASATQSAPSKLLGPRIRTALFEISAGDPGETPRVTLWAIAVLCALLLVWAIFAKLDIVAVADGRLVPQTYVKIVQPADSGIVREILVDEGDYVEAGQILLRLDPTVTTADSTAIDRELQSQKLQIRRIDAELSGTSLTRSSDDDAELFAQAEAQRASHREQFMDSLAQERATKDRATRELLAATEVLRKLEKTLPSYQRSADAYAELATKKLVGAIEAEEKHREAIEKAQDLETQRATVASLQAAVAQSEKRLAQLRSTYESELHAARLDATSKITQLEQQRAKLAFHQENLQLRAPQAGTIKDLATTSIGAVVQPGTVLLTLVPVHEPLIAEVSIKNEDIGFVREGQTVRLKLATYPFQKYGMIEGVVKTVMADSSMPEQAKSAPSSNQESMGQASIYKAVIGLKEQQLKTNEATFPLAAGMQLNAEIIEGKRTVMEYLLSPVQRVRSEAGMER